MSNILLVQDTDGLKMVDGSLDFSGEVTAFPTFEGKVRNMTTSGDGRRIAWISGGEICVVEGPPWVRIGTLIHPKANEVCFSPTGKYVYN